MSPSTHIDPFSILALHYWPQLDDSILLRFIYFCCLYFYLRIRTSNDGDDDVESRSNMISVVLTDVQPKCLFAKKNENIGKIKIKAIVIGLPSDPCASMSSNIFFPVHIVAHKITEITTKPTELIKTTIFFCVSCFCGIS